MVLFLDVVLPLLMFSRLFPYTLAQQNISVDDTDPSISYVPSGAWILSAPSSLDFGGTHMLTQNPNATATFTFTGIAIYFFSPKWPYLVNTQLALDGSAPVLIDLVDHSRPDTLIGPETVQSSVVWSATGLNNTEHTLVVSVGNGQPFGVVDGIIFTQAANTTDTATMPSTSASSTTMSPQTLSSTSITTASSSSTDIPPAAPPLKSQPQSAISSKKLRIAPIVVGGFFGILGLLIVGLSIYFTFKRRQRPKSEAWTDGGAYTPAGPYSIVDSIGSVRGRGVRIGYPMMQTPGGTWQNPFYGYVGGPPPAPPYGGDPHASVRAPNRYIPGMTLSTITERSTPRLAPGSVSLAPSPESGLSKELPSGAYFTAPASDASGRMEGARALPEHSMRTLHVPGSGTDKARAGWM